jgi:hypothetical protein
LIALLDAQGQPTDESETSRQVIDEVIAEHGRTA